ncbi:hypothetical protein PENCOP_c011G02590 [Penicillium coprophilum]|uniref:Uncharacterized protein n=1 Tax=Penicillium coprophilum TaxID=36646 RepID=A0A1V6UEV4_9EURO|nr:hypothetical protein PENCOP_c011G02590 [Penicillium coprophilum]
MKFDYSAATMVQLPVLDLAVANIQDEPSPQNSFCPVSTSDIPTCLVAFESVPLEKHLEMATPL